VHPLGPGPSGAAKLYAPTAIIDLSAEMVITVGDFGRALAVSDEVQVVVGYEPASASASSMAAFAPLLSDPRGVVFDPVAFTLVVTEYASGDIRVIGVDTDRDGVVDDAERWTNESLQTDLRGPAGIAYDTVTDSFLVADLDDHCIRRLNRDGAVLEAAFGQCGSPGRFPGFLSGPTHIVVSPTTSAFYISDTGNHRVLRVQDGQASLVIGDGSVSSAGEGAPARLFPVNAPRQLAMDEFGNLFVASTTTLRLVANVDGDADADGDDRVFTIFGGGDRLSFPESDTFCLNTAAIGEDGAVYAADACQGYMVKVTAVVD